LEDVQFLAQDYSIADIGAFTWVKCKRSLDRTYRGVVLGR
jgi:hypothetical protein